MSYRNNIHNMPPAPCYYVIHLSSNTTLRSSGSSYTWHINLPQVSSIKQYFIRPTRVFIQDLNPANGGIRAVVMTSQNCRLQNSYSSGLASSGAGTGAGYSNILGVFELQHTTKNNNDFNYVAYTEEPHMNFLSGGFINGGALQNSEFEIRFCDLNNADIAFNSTEYADFFVELSLFEIYNPQYTISNQYDHDKIKYEGTNMTQVQGSTR